MYIRRMTLTEFLKKHKITQQQFAEIVKCRQGTVSRLCRGSTRPSLRLAHRIEVATGGKIPATSWVDCAEGDGRAA